MTGFSISFDASEALRGLGRLIRKCEDPRDALDAVGFEFSQRADRTFDDQADPWNAAWRPLSPLTLRLRRKAGKGAEILRDTGRLSQSITHNLVGDEVHIGTNVEYAAPHQLGGGVPYRPFMPIREDGTPDLPDAWTRGGIEIVENILRQQGAFD